MKRFLRRIWSRYSKLGRHRKKKQKWRRPTGRDNKMRERRTGYASRVSIGYMSNKKTKGKPLKIVSNIQDFKGVNEKDLVIIGKVGKKKKIEILKMAKEKKVEIQNINSKKFLKKIGKGKNKHPSEIIQEKKK